MYTSAGPPTDIFTSHLPELRINISSGKASFEKTSSPSSNLLIEQILAIASSSSLASPLKTSISDKNFKETTDLVVDLIKKHKNENQLCISSFHHEYNKELLQFPLNIQFQFLYNSELKLEYPSEETYKNNKRGTVNMFYGCITEDIVKEAHSKNFGVMAWCNKKKNDKVKVEEDEETFLNLMKMGVDIICSNKPEVAINARKKFIESLSLSEGTSEGLSEGIPVSN